MGESRTPRLSRGAGEAYASPASHGGGGRSAGFPPLTGEMSARTKGARHLGFPPSTGGKCRKAKGAAERDGGTAQTAPLSMSTASVVRPARPALPPPRAPFVLRTFPPRVGESRTPRLSRGAGEAYASPASHGGGGRSAGFPPLTGEMSARTKGARHLGFPPLRGGNAVRQRGPGREGWRHRANCAVVYEHRVSRSAGTPRPSAAPGPLCPGGHFPRERGKAVRLASPAERGKRTPRPFHMEGAEEVPGFPR